MLDKMRSKYVNVSITEDLAKLLDKTLKNTELGYRSRAEFISEAIREKIQKITQKKRVKTT